MFKNAVRKYLCLILVVSQVLSYAPVSAADPQHYNGRVKSTEDTEVNMPPDEASQVVADANRTIISDLVGGGPAPITDSQLNRLREKLKKAVDANYVIKLIPSKKPFFKFWKKHEAEGLQAARLNKKVTLQRMIVTIMGLSLLAQVNSAYDLVPFTYWLDANIQNPVLKEVSMGSIETLEYLGGQMVAGGQGFVNAISSSLVQTFSLVFIGGAVGALAVRPQNVLNQKLNVVGGLIFAPFTSWLSKFLDDQTDKIERFNLKSRNAYRKMKGLPPVSLDAGDSDDLALSGRAALSSVQRLQRHWQAEGLTSNMTNAAYTQYLARERILWMEFQQEWQNNFTEQQRTGRSNIWEAVYYSPQHFASLIRAALNSSDNLHEHYIKSLERMASEHPANADEIKSLGKKLKNHARTVRANELEDPGAAQLARVEIAEAQIRLAEIGIDTEDIQSMLSRINRSIIAKNEAVMNLVIYIKRDLDYGIYTSDLPESAYNRLITVRNELGLDYYIRELREEMIALGSEFELTLKAYDHFLRVFKHLKTQTTQNNTKASEKSKTCSQLLDK